MVASGAMVISPLTLVYGGALELTPADRKHIQCSSLVGKYSIQDKPADFHRPQQRSCLVPLFGMLCPDVDHWSHSLWWLDRAMLAACLFPSHGCTCHGMRHNVWHWQVRV
jgi:hypothetical protein